MKRMDACFNVSEAEAVRRNSSPLCVGWRALADDLSVSFLKKTSLKMNQCWAVGFSILELSKLVMQDAYYNHVVKQLPESGVSVLMSDTDSWVLLCKAESTDEVVDKLGEQFMDCSNYAEQHPRHTVHNKAKVGKFKNEMPEAEISKFVGVRAKAYAFDTEGSGDNTRKCKGVGKAFVKKLSFEDYLKCVEEKSTLEVQQVQLQTRNHVTNMVSSLKRAFDSADDKRYSLCNIHTTPYGSYLAEQHEKTGVCYFCRNPDKLC